MAERDEVSGLLGGHDTRQLSHGQHAALGTPLRFLNEEVRGGREFYGPACPCEALGHAFAANIHHTYMSRRVNVRGWGGGGRRGRGRGAHPELRERSTHAQLSCYRSGKGERNGQRHTSCVIEWGRIG